MPLQKQLVPIVLAGGVDTKTDPKQVVPGKLLQLENATFVSPKQIKKSPGYVSLPTTILGNVTTEITSGQGLMGYAGEMLLASNNRLYSFTAASNSWANKGSLLSVSVGGYLVNRDPIEERAADCAIYESATGGLALFAWEEKSGSDVYVNYSIIDTGTQQIVVPSTRTPTVGGDAHGSSPRCFAMGANLVLMWVDVTGNVLSAMPIPVSSPQNHGAVVTVASDLLAGVYDACLNTGTPPFPGAPVGNAVYVAYDNSGGGSVIGAAILRYNMTASSTTVAAVGDASGGISIVTAPSPLGTFSITYSSASAVRNVVVDTSLTVVSADALVEAVAAWNVASTFDGLTTTAFYSIKGSPTWKSSIRKNTKNLGAAAGTASRVVGLYLASKAFTANGNTYMLAGYASASGGIQNTYFLIDSSGVTQAKVLGNSAGGFPATHGLPQVTLQASGAYLVATLVQDFLVSSVSVAQQDLTVDPTTGTAATSLFSLTGVQATELTLFEKGLSYARAELADALHVTGGYLSMYDSAEVVEHGFHLWPENLSASFTGGSGAISGTYSYIGVYEWTDAQGNRHQSAPSQAYSLVLTSAANVIDGSHTSTVTFPYLRVTQKTGVVLVVYRTELNGTEYFRVTNVLSPTPNNPAGDTVTIADNVPDGATGLLAGTPLYTLGGVVENVAPPACSAIATGSNRLWVLSSANPLQVWYSKQVSPGVPAAFSDLFVINMDPRGGPVTAIANMDDYEVFFKRSSIFIVAGDGPDDTGQQNSFQTPKLVATDSGCVDPRSVVLFPGGLMYKSDKGIYVLNRGLAADYVGAEVERFNSLAVVSANLVSNRNQVRFNLEDGTQLVYDYFMQQWATRPLFGLVDATTREDQYFYLDSNGIAYAEDPSSYAIAGRSYSLKLQTSWLTLGGPNGFQRVYGLMLLGDWKSPHTLRVSIAYDYDETPTQIVDIAAEAFDPGFWGDGFTWGDGAPPAPTPNVTTPALADNYYKSPGGVVGPVATSDILYARSLGYTPATLVEANAAYASGTTLAAGGDYVWGGRYPLYQFRVNFSRQKCAAVQITIEDLQVNETNINGDPAQPGEGYSISNLSFIVGVKEGWNKVGAARVVPVTTP